MERPLAANIDNTINQLSWLKKLDDPNSIYDSDFLTQHDRAKRRLSTQLTKDTKAFLKNGGKITSLNIAKRTENKPSRRAVLQQRNHWPYNPTNAHTLKKTS